MILTFGKYKGIRINEVYKNDKQYLIDLLKNNEIDKDLKVFIAYYFPDLVPQFDTKDVNIIVGNNKTKRV